MTLFVEDLIHRLAYEGPYMFFDEISMPTNDLKFFSSLSRQLVNKNGLTLKQKNLSLKLIKKHSSILSQEFAVDINAFLLNPQFKMAERILSTEKEIKIVKDSQGDYSIHVIFSYDETLISQFRNYKNSIPTFQYQRAYWDQELKVWNFGLTEHNILFLSTLSGFKKDEKFNKYHQELLKVQETIKTYIPYVVKNEDGVYTFKNKHKNIPDLQFNNMLESLIIAKKYGITVWSEEIDQELDKIDNNLLKSFLRSGYTTNIFSKNRIIELTELEELIKVYDKILFVIPGGQEFKYLNKSYEFLKQLGFTATHCSVMFRLEKFSDRNNCNNFIHEESLNNPLEENTKFVFISAKIPKPVIEANIEFDLIINFGLNSAHYSLQKFLKNHHNIVTINTTYQEYKNYVYV